MNSRRLRVLVVLFGFCVFALACGGSSPDDPIQSARSAAPASISAEATVMDWDLNVISEGSNVWTCLPDRPDTPGPDPWCVTDACENGGVKLDHRAAV